MADPVVIAQVATAGGTLVLALATFSSIRASNRSVKVAERSLLAAQRPVLIPSREDDLPETVRFGSGVTLHVGGHSGVVKLHDGQLYMALALRNGGAGLAVIHGWHVVAEGASPTMPKPRLEDFRPQQRDLYVPADQTGFWQARIRGEDDPFFGPMRERVEAGERVMVDVLYGDYEGAQRSIARFGLSTTQAPREGDYSERAEILRYWDLEGIGGRQNPTGGSPPD
ncbi:MAG TPA: hypothetical protein VG405_14005 [Solirubrobacteraceae bacterium]|jgi:hypothetical protein|nr:hypothetical protein [Solirubrobacteraceae bacterium]